MPTRIYYCEQCDQEIVGFQMNDQVFSAAELAESRKRKTGRYLCAFCYRDHKRRQYSAPPTSQVLELSHIPQIVVSAPGVKIEIHIHQE